jgi:lysophospholipase L1-like esterase
MDLAPHGPQPTFWQKNARKTAVALSPVLVAQGRWVRAKIPRLPHAPEPWTGELPGPQEISILGFGDSTIAGVGVSDPRLGLTAQFSHAVHAEMQRGVRWRAVGRSGATTEDLLGPFLPSALEGEADVIVISIGANDAKNLKPLGATVDRFQRLLDVLNEGHPNATLLFSSLPAFYLFDTLPQPLRSVIYQHSQAIERSVRPLIEERPYAFMSPPPPRYTDGFFAVDGFHPSEQGYRDWALFALRDALERGALEHLKRR